MRRPAFITACSRLFPRWQNFRRLIITRPVFNDRSHLHNLLGPLAMLLLIFFAGQVAWIFYGLQPSTISDTIIQLDIPMGSSVKEVGVLLEKEGLITNSNSFVWYVYLTGKQRQVKAGRYHLQPGTAFTRLMAELQKGRSVYHRVTIPEGLTQKEISELLVRRGLVDEKRFWELLHDREFLLSYLPEFNPRSAEGFLFPDTYDFADGASEEEILAVFFRRFLQVWSAIARGKTVRNLSLVDLVTLASIIEREAKKAEERPVIAAVFLNRLRMGYPLQSCATVMYALGERRSRLLYDDLKIESPYNTYLYRGLPPGPISNPGRASLTAALYPVETDFLYFVARPDGTHIFSRTYREHLRAQNELNARP